MNSACVSVARAAPTSASGSSLTALSTRSVNSFPMTAAVCRMSFSRSGSRSMRAASTACTVGGTTSSATGLTSRYAPFVPTRLPPSTSAWTTSSMKKGFPAVRSRTGPTTPASDGLEPSRSWSEPALARLGVHALSPALGVRHVEEVEEERERFGELRVEQEHRAGDLPAACLVAILLGDAEVPAQELENREEGIHPPAGDAVRLVGRETARAGSLDELVAE